MELGHLTLRVECPRTLALAVFMYPVILSNVSLQAAYRHITKLPYLEYNYVGDIVSEGSVRSWSSLLAYLLHSRKMEVDRGTSDET
jgi:hypothetical protein